MTRQRWGPKRVIGVILACFAAIWLVHYLQNRDNRADFAAYVDLLNAGEFETARDHWLRLS